MFNTVRSKRPQNTSVELLEARSYLHALLSAPTNYVFNSSADCIAVADFNGDGVPDIVAGGYNPDGGGGGISTYLGRPDGSFGAEQSIAFETLGDAILSVATSDFNRDGKADVVAATGSGAYIFLGDGTGGFAAPHKSSSDALIFNATKIVTGDLNGDGTPDLVTALDSRIEISPGNGDGTFQGYLGSESSLSIAASTVALGDVNGDSRLDIVAFNGQHAISSLGNGDGTFQTGVVSPIASFSSDTAIALADLNNDGLADLIFTTRGTAVGVALGSTDGTFLAPQTYALPATATAVTVGDLNGDGNSDVIVATVAENIDTPIGAYDSGAVSVLIGNGDGTLQTPQNFTTSSSLTNGITLASFNQVNALEVVLSNRGGGGVSVLKNDVLASLAAVSPPLAPIHLGSAANAKVISLVWKASKATSYYQVFRGTHSGFSSATMIATHVKVPRYTDVNAKHGQTYYYFIRAVNSGGKSPVAGPTKATIAKSKVVKAITPAATIASQYRVPNLMLVSRGERTEVKELRDLIDSEGTT